MHLLPFRRKVFKIYPDFQTGGYIDVGKIQRWRESGSVKVRSTITKLDNRTLIIKDVPFGRTTSSVVDSILKANEKVKLKLEGLTI